METDKTKRDGNETGRKGSLGRKREKKSIGFAQLSRELLFDPIRKNSDLTNLYLELHLRANFRNNYYCGVIVPPGHVVFGRKEMAATLEINEFKVERLLTKLVEMGKIIQYTRTKHRLIEVVDWGKTHASDTELGKRALEIFVNYYLQYAQIEPKTPITKVHSVSHRKLRPETDRTNLFLGNVNGQISIKTQIYTVYFRKKGGISIHLKKDKLHELLEKVHTPIEGTKELNRDINTINTINTLLSFDPILEIGRKNYKNSRDLECTNQNLKKDTFRFPKTVNTDREIGRAKEELEKLNYSSEAEIYQIETGSQTKEKQKPKGRPNMPDLRHSYPERIEIVKAIGEILGINHQYPDTSKLIPENPSGVVNEAINILQDIKTMEFKKYKFDNDWLNRFKVRIWPTTFPDASWEEISAQVLKSAHRLSESLRINPKMYKPKTVAQFLFNPMTGKSEMLKYLNRQVTTKTTLITDNFLKKIAPSCVVSFEKLYNTMRTKIKVDPLFFWKNVYGIQKFYEDNILEIYFANNFGYGGWENIDRLDKMPSAMVEFIEEKDFVPFGLLEVGSGGWNNFTQWWKNVYGVEMVWEKEKVLRYGRRNILESRRGSVQTLCDKKVSEGMESLAAWNSAEDEIYDTWEVQHREYLLNRLWGRLAA